MGEDLKTASAPIDLDELFGGGTVVAMPLNGGTISARLREPTEAEDFACRNAVDLFNIICMRVEVDIGGVVEDVPDFKARLSPEAKSLIISHFARRIQ